MPINDNNIEMPIPPTSTINSSSGSSSYDHNQGGVVQRLGNWISTTVGGAKDSLSNVIHPRYDETHDAISRNALGEQALAKAQTEKASERSDDSVLTHFGHKLEEGKQLGIAEAEFILGDLRRHPEEELQQQKRIDEKAEFKRQVDVSPAPASYPTHAYAQGETEAKSLFSFLSPKQQDHTTTISPSSSTVEHAAEGISAKTKEQEARARYILEKASEQSSDPLLTKFGHKLEEVKQLGIANFEALHSKVQKNRVEDDLSGDSTSTVHSVVEDATKSLEAKLVEQGAKIQLLAEKASERQDDTLIETIGHKLEEARLKGAATYESVKSDYYRKMAEQNLSSTLPSSGSSSTSNATSTATGSTSSNSNQVTDPFASHSLFHFGTIDSDIRTPGGGFIGKDELSFDNPSSKSGDRTSGGGFKMGDLFKPKHHDADNSALLPPQIDLRERTLVHEDIPLADKPQEPLFQFLAGSGAGKQGPTELELEVAKMKQAQAQAQVQNRARSRSPVQSQQQTHVPTHTVDNSVPVAPEKSASSLFTSLASKLEEAQDFGKANVEQIKNRFRSTSAPKSGETIADIPSRDINVPASETNVPKPVPEPKSTRSTTNTSSTVGGTVTEPMACLPVSVLEHAQDAVAARRKEEDARNKYNAEKAAESTNDPLLTRIGHKLEEAKQLGVAGVEGFRADYHKNYIKEELKGVDPDKVKTVEFTNF